MPALAPSRDKLLQAAQQLPASPQILLRLGELLSDVNSGLDDVASLLRRDTGLAARVIRISNSVVFGMGGGIATVEEAVNRVGFAEIYRLVGLATAAQLGEFNLSFYGLKGTELRDNTMLVALAAEALANRAGAASRVAYTAGLLRSTGKLVLDRYAKLNVPHCPPLLNSGTPNMRTWEENNFHSSNPEAAHIVLSGWRFPTSISTPVRHQYETSLPAGEDGAITTLLQISCRVAQSAGFALFGETEFDERRPSVTTLSALGLTPSLVDEAAEEAVAHFEAVKNTL
jgi:HD-like signal output (HDOD) protein